MIARRLSQFFALGLAMLTYWSAVSGPNVIDPEFAGMLYALFAVLVAGIFGILFVAMRFVIAGSVNYWSGSGQPTEVSRIFIMISTALAVHLSAGWFFILQGRLTETAIIVSLLTWTIVPAIFVALGIVKLPVRQKNATLRRIILTGAIGLTIALAVSAVKFSSSPLNLQISESRDIFASAVNLVAAATAEEIVFRFLLFTALLELTRSRFNAVFLSSVVFGLVHAPVHLLQPVVYGDWPVLVSGAQAYAPVFLLQTLIGVFLCVLWLRTGSISLVVVAHAVINAGPTFLTDF